MVLVLPLLWLGTRLATGGFPFFGGSGELWKGPKASWGAMVFGAIAFFIWTWRVDPRTRLARADVCALCLSVAAIGVRLGCASVHDHLGRPAESWWPVAFVDHAGTRRHDLGLYEMLLWVTVAVLGWRRLGSSRAGHVASLILCGYGVGRFVLELNAAATLPTRAQVAALGVLSIGLWLRRASDSALDVQRPSPGSQIGRALTSFPTSSPWVTPRTMAGVKWMPPYKREIAASAAASRKSRKERGANPRSTCVRSTKARSP